MQQFRSTIVKIGYLYMAVAHYADLELSEKELGVIFNKILNQLGGVGKVSNIEFKTILKEVGMWYDDTRENTVDKVTEIAKSLASDTSFNENSKMRILQDLVEISLADGEFKYLEKGMISNISSIWNIKIPL